MTRVCYQSVLSGQRVVPVGVRVDGRSAARRPSRRPECRSTAAWWRRLRPLPAVSSSPSSSRCSPWPFTDERKRCTH